MPIDVTWDNEADAILYWELHKPWTFEEFAAAMDTSKELVAELEGIFDLILNANNVPPPHNPLQFFRSSLRGASPKQNMMVLVQTPAFVRQLTLILQRMKDPNLDEQRLFFADTVDAARQMIYKQRENQKR